MALPDTPFSRLEEYLDYIASGVYGDANTCAIVIDTDGTIRYGSWSENKTLSNVYWQAVYPCED
ncbi:MAG: hypothetical protein IJ794_20210 [Lachnospiraceae bacterium]|nr:hypothetical protein [Lachnospiraceae bacterium]